MAPPWRARSLGFSPGGSQRSHRGSEHVESGETLGRCPRLHARLQTDLASLPELAPTDVPTTPPTVGASSGHLAGQSTENLCPNHPCYLCSSIEPPSHVARTARHTEVSSSTTYSASSLQLGLCPPAHGAVASSSPPSGRPQDLGAELGRGVAQVPLHPGYPHRRQTEGPAWAYVTHRSASAHHGSAFHQCSGGRRPRSHSQNLPPQGVRQGAQSTAVATASTSSPSPQLPSATSETTAHTLFPRVHIDQGGFETGETTHSTPPQSHPLLFCKKCRNGISWTAPPGFHGPADSRTCQHPHDQVLSQEHPHVLTTSSCLNGDPAAPAVRPATGEDFCLLPTVFRQWLLHLPPTFPHPQVDTWASPQQHLLPLYGVDFFNTVYPENWILWLNPRFSQITAVLRRMQQHHLQGYLLFPHWDDKDWWTTIWQDLTHQWFFPHGMHAFFGTSQSPTATQPIGWPFSIAFFTFSTTTPATPPDHSRNRYWQLLSGAKYPPLVPHYGVLPLPKCFRTAVSCPRPKPCTFLAPVSTHVIDYRALLDMGHRLHFPKLPLLQAMVRALSCPLAFHALHRTPLHPGPGHPSTLSQACLQQAVQFRILDAGTKPKLCSAAFLIPKSDPTEGGRLILPCKDTNKALQLPLWPCELAAVVTVISSVLSWSYAVEFDYRSYYFQFALGKLIQPWFGVRKAGFRAVYTKLPQGWSPAASVAQTTSELCIYNLLPSVPGPPINALVHIDNTALGGPTEEYVRQLKHEFMQRCDCIGIELKHRHVPITTQLQYVGIDFDLTMKQYRLLPQWAHATASFIAEVSKVLEDGYHIPLRIIWQVLGNIFWTAHVSQLALGSFWRMMQFTRRTAPKATDNRSAWDKPHTVPAGVLAEWKGFHERLAANPWLTPPPRSPALNCFKALMASDSSVPAGGFCWQVLPPDQHLKVIHHAAWWQWPPRVYLRFSLPAREALAAVRASQEALISMSTPAIWLVDCLPVLQALHKGSSGKPVLNALILALRKLVGILWIWVPTGLMPADEYSRKRGFSPMQPRQGTILNWQLQQFLYQQMQKPPLHIVNSWLII